MSAQAFLRQAIELALRSVAEGGGPFGAIVVRAGRVVGSGTNRVVPDGDPTAHAEMEAIRAAARALGTHDLAGCTLFSSCEPCPMCRGAVQWARLEGVHYACDRDDAAAAGFDDARFSARATPPRGVQAIPHSQELREEGLAVFRAWLEKPDRVSY